ncbi:kinase-like domain-containing protein [Gilbertella persicaria]|uniref:kinase-like domain-containing protein n=1 Tax=Gilbertella persicaria TaxID=101096 RepID=UPI002220A261|nr:kinase-like domain-containing protein [Gilbertella persicaria]KAI8049805.1 kinase-like domain-containing protein [Gilbertella persicaria]
MMFLFTSARDTIYALTSCCFPNPTIRINKKNYKVINLLGEGGYSFVYLVQDESSRQLYALKKIRCPVGDRTLTDVMHEIDMYKKFKSEYTIQLVDTSIVTDSDGTKTVYIFLPYYKRGNLQDNINANNVNKSFFPERDLLEFFLKVCFALKVLHTLMPSADNTSDCMPYAHRDLKPGNILISDDGKTPILMDFGSVSKARIPIHSRQDALLQQDIAAENSTIPYRAPELFDVQTGTTLDEKVDIWSLGCTVYAAAYGQNPFEASVNEMGGSLALAILNSNYKFPTDKEQDDPYSDEFKNFIRFLLVNDPKDRPDINQVIAKLESLLNK